MTNIYPQQICGPLLPLFHGNYDESKLKDITINNKDYKIDKYGNVTGFKNCVFLYNSVGYLEEIGVFENNSIIEYTFGYTFGYTYLNDDVSEETHICVCKVCKNN